MSTAVQFNNVTCKIGNKLIIDQLNLSVAQGAIMGVLGPNGAGKTTLLSLILGLRNCTEGELTVLSHKMPQKSAALRQRIGVILQETALYDELTTFENLLFLASLYNVENAAKRIDEVLLLLHLSEQKTQRVSTLSGGMRRRVAIARALLHDPELLIIDEPTLGVDVEARHAIWSHLRLLKSKGRTVIVATNYLDEALALCDQVAVLRGGKLLSCETPDALVSRAGHCLDVECDETEVEPIRSRLEEHRTGILRIEKNPGGLTVFLHGQTVSKDIINLILQNSQASGFRLRAPDLVEVFRSLDDKVSSS